MRRGTTPVVKATIKGIEVSELQSLYLTFDQGDVQITKEKDDITIDEETNTIKCQLSQSDTLEFGDGNVKIQLRAVTKDGIAVASSIKSKPMGEILKDGEIE